MKHASLKMKRREEGEAGVGTIILFIALTLCAAMTAGILIDTVGTMQQQGQLTADKSADSISTGFRVYSMIGDRVVDSGSNATQSTIQVLEVKVGIMPGSGAIDMSKVVIEAVTVDVKADMTCSAAGTTAVHGEATEFVVVAIQDSDSSMTTKVMNEGDIVRLIISTDQWATNMDLDPSDTIAVKIIPKVGMTAFVSATLPAVFTTRYIEIK